MFKETDRVELKREFNDSLKKEIIAFANTNGGKIYIGIDDDGNIIGLSNAKENMEAISNSISDAIRPDLRMFTSINLLTIEGKEIIEIEVLKGTKKPYHLTSKGMKSSGVFIRHGITTHPASEDIIRQMINDNEGTSYERLRCLNQDLTFEYAEKFFKKRNIIFKKVQQRTLGLIDEDGYYTNFGLLLSDQCEHSIKCAVYNGNTKLEFRDRKEFGGSILHQLDDVYDYISLQNKTNSHFEGLRRIDKFEYPIFAIRETLINAIVHRDYSFSGSILIHIFDNRIEFVSIGGLVSGLTKNDILLGVSESRNKFLANCFYRLELIESYGTGIQRINESYNNAKEKPKIEISEHAFVVTLPNMNYKIEISNKDKVLDIIMNRPKTSRAFIEKELGLSKTSVTLLLKELIAEGKIIQEGKARNTVYKPILRNYK